MAKFKKNVAGHNNHRVTDFFSQQPRSSQPQHPSSSASTTSGLSLKTPSLSRKTALTQTQPKSHSQQNKMSSSHISRLSSVKKENAPPLLRSRAPLEREVTYVSSSSDAPTAISISSTSILSVDNSVVEVVPTVRQDRNHLRAFEVTPSRRRRSPRLQNSQAPSQRKSSVIVVASSPRKQSPKKRKKPEGIQSDDGDVIDLDGMEEVIYVTSKPAMVNLVTPTSSPPPRPRPSPARKRCRLQPPPPSPPPDTSSDAEEVIPSSQSDEQELSILKKQRKDPQKVAESIKEWRMSSSQPGVPPESSDPFGTSYDDPGLGYDFDQPLSSPSPRIPQDKPKTPVSVRKAHALRSSSTPRGNSQLHTPSKAPSSPQNIPASAILDPIRVPGGSRQTSPQLASSASSTTKVDSLVRLSPFKKSTAPRDVQCGKSVMSEAHSLLSRSQGLVADDARTVMDIDVPLVDQNRKTESIVERIKAEARAKAMALPDEDNMTLRSLEDSDSELGSPTNIASRLAKNKKPAGGLSPNDGSEPPLTDNDELDFLATRRKSGRHVARRSTSPSSSSTTARTRKAPHMLPNVLSVASRIPPKKKAVNPLSKLLKEKARDERFLEIRGNSGFDIELDVSDAEKDDAGEGPSGSGKILQRQNSDEVDVENVVGEADRRRLFGDEDNTALGKIIESDQRERGKGKAVDDVEGVHFWQRPAEEAMEFDPSAADLPCFQYDGDDPSLKLLKEFLDETDVDGTAVLLLSGTFDIADALFAEWLFEVAVCFTGALAAAAHTVLSHISDSRVLHGQDLFVSISPVLKAFSMFGARSDILDALHVEVQPCAHRVFSAPQRTEALWRLSELVSAFASKMMLEEEDVPSYFALVLAIGMDASTSFNLRASIKRTLKTLIRVYCGDFSDGRGEMETEICSKVLRLIPDSSPANKQYLLSYIDGDDLVSRRIGQWIAFAMLTGDYGSRLAREVMAGPPPLSDIVALLNRRPDSRLRSNIFNVSRSSDQTDYFDYAALRRHIEILGRVLMNIPQYLLIEKAEAKANADGTMSKQPNEISKLDTIKASLERLGNNIADTRAAHLDRSHAKAVIQQLAMRVHYQRKSSSSNTKIHNFFVAS